MFCCSLYAVSQNKSQGSGAEDEANVVWSMSDECSVIQGNTVRVHTDTPWASQGLELLDNGLPRSVMWHIGFWVDKVHIILVTGDRLLPRSPTECNLISELLSLLYLLTTLLRCGGSTLRIGLIQFQNGGLRECQKSISNGEATLWPRDWVLTIHVQNTVSWS